MSPEKRRAVSPEKRNGFTHSEMMVEVRTELSVDEVLMEILRTARSLKIREVEKNGPSSIEYTWSGVKTRVIINKEHCNCKLSFQWVSGGDMISYREKCDKLSKKLRL